MYKKRREMAADPTTQANYTQIASEHIDFDWTIDYAKKIISGTATHTFVVKEGGVTEAMCVLYYDCYKCRDLT